MKCGIASASILLAKTKMIFILQGSRSSKLKLMTKAKGSLYNLFPKLVQCQDFLVYLKRCSHKVLSDFINLTQVHNFTVSAQDILPSVDFWYLP